MNVASNSRPSLLGLVLVANTYSLECDEFVHFSVDFSDVIKKGVWGLEGSNYLKVFWLI